MAWPFSFDQPATEPEPLRLPSLRQVSERINRPREPVSATARHGRVLSLVCRKGRVCSETFACPCQAEDHRPRWYAS